MCLQLEAKIKVWSDGELGNRMKRPGLDVVGPRDQLAEGFRNFFTMIGRVIVPRNGYLTRLPGHPCGQP